MNLDYHFMLTGWHHQNLSFFQRARGRLLSLGQFQHTGTPLASWSRVSNGLNDRFDLRKSSEMEFMFLNIRSEKVYIIPSLGPSRRFFGRRLAVSNDFSFLFP